MAVSFTTAVLIAGASAAVGAYLNGQNKEAEERRDREMEALRRNALTLSNDTQQLRELVARQQQAAESEQGLVQRVDLLTKALVQVHTMQGKLQGTLEVSNRDLLVVHRNKEEIQRELKEALRVNGERNDAYERVHGALLKAQEENKNLNVNLTDVRQEREKTHSNLSALHEENTALSIAVADSQRACEELTQLLTIVDNEAKKLEMDLKELKGVNEVYDHQIEWLTQAVEDLERNKEVKQPVTAPALKTVSGDEMEDLEDPKLQKALALSLEENPLRDPALDKALQQMDDEELAWALEDSLKGVDLYTNKKG